MNVTLPLSILCDLLQRSVEESRYTAGPRSRGLLCDLCLHATETLVLLLEQPHPPHVIDYIDDWFESWFILGNGSFDEDDHAILTPRTFTPDAFVRLLHAVRVRYPSHHRYKAFSAVQSWLYEWIQGTGDTTGLLGRFDAVPWMGEFKANMKRLEAYNNDRFLEAVTRWCLPAWQSQADYIHRILSSPLILRPQAPCWPVLARDTVLYTEIEQWRNKDHHGWLQRCHYALWLELRDLRRRRHRIALKAVWIGGVMWGVYQLWSLHPDRLREATSALATVTAETRAVMRDEATTAAAAAPMLPATFRLLAVADYFGL